LALSNNNQFSYVPLSLKDIFISNESGSPHNKCLNDEFTHNDETVNDDILPNYVVKIEKEREKIMTDFDKRINETCIQLKRIDDQLKELI